MTLAYRTMYRLGFTPWEHAEPPPVLVDLIEGPGALPPGRMLDLGCGTGLDAIYAAAHGWDVAGIDDVPTAIARARRNAVRAKAKVRWIIGDVSRTPVDDLGGPFGLVLDIGCFDALDAAARDRVVTAITAVTEPGAVLLMFAFVPRENGRVGPRGVDPDALPGLFPGWRIDSTTADDVQVGGPMRHVPRFWHRLVRSC